jgi:hypothetical protein
VAVELGPQLKLVSDRCRPVVDGHRLDAARLGESWIVRRGLPPLQRRCLSRVVVVCCKFMGYGSRWEGSCG